MKILEYVKKHKKAILGLSLVSLLFLFVNLELIIGTFRMVQVPGWDAMTHFAFAQYYSQHIFPSTFGWIPTWFNGMPFPQFYPPGFYFAFALLDHVFFFLTPATLFKLFVLSNHLVAIFLLGLLYRKFVDQKGDGYLWVMTVSVFLGSFSFRVADMGYGITSSLNVGLVTHAFAMVLLLAWLHFMFGIGKGNSRALILSSLLLAGVILTSVHAAFSALLLYALAWTVDVVQKPTFKDVLAKTGRYVFSGLLALALSSFWILPYLELADYSTARSMRAMLPNVFEFGIKNLIAPCLALAALYFQYRERRNFNPVICIVSMYVLITYALFFSNIHSFSSVPLHVDRLFATSFMLLPVLIVFLLSHIQEHLRKLALSALVLVLLLASLHPYFKAEKLNFLITFDDYSEVEREVLSMRNRHALVEVSYDGGSFDSYLNSILGLNGNRTSVAILRESSVSSVFNTPLRNSFSVIREYWAIRAPLSVDEKFLNRPVEQKIEDAKMIGVTDLLVRSRIRKDEMTEAGFPETKVLGKWNRYELAYRPDESSDIEILAFKPVLVFSDLDFKKYRKSGSDFVSLAEALQGMHERDIRIVHAEADNLNALDLDSYSQILIDGSYRTEHPELEEMIRSRTSAPLHITGESEISDASLYDVGTEIAARQDLLERVRENKRPILRPLIKDILYVEKDNEFVISNRSDREAHIVIKRSYFPAWESEKALLQLVNPSLGYVHLEAGQSATFVLKKPRSVQAGSVMSALTLAGVIGFLSVIQYRSRRKF